MFRVMRSRRASSGAEGVENPVHFPREADTIFEQAEAYRQLSPTDRLLAILDLIASGVAMMNESPHP
jgi:hypothetical protein